MSSTTVTPRMRHARTQSSRIGVVNAGLARIPVGVMCISKPIVGYTRTIPMCGHMMGRETTQVACLMADDECRGRNGTKGTSTVHITSLGDCHACTWRTRATSNVDAARCRIAQLDQNRVRPDYLGVR